MMNRGPRLLASSLAAAGFVVSGVLEYVHAKAYLMPTADSFCRVGERFDCGVVALSRMSVVLGVPLPVWGAAGFLALGIAALRCSRLLLPLAAVAALVSVGLLVESLTHVGTLCLLCEVVHALSLLLFGVAWWQRDKLDRDAPIGRQALDVLLTPVALVLLAMLFAPRYWQPLTWQDGVPYAHGFTEEGDPWIGAESPTVVVEEVVDYGCPHCAIASNRMRIRLARDADELRVVRQHMPRFRCTPGTDTCLPLRAAICAGQQDKFWEMDAWLFMHAPGKAKVDVMEGARAIGLDEAAFSTCLQDPATYERGVEERRRATKRRARHTPAYFVDGKHVGVEEIHDLLDDKL